MQHALGTISVQGTSFGLVNSPAVFNRAMRDVLKDMEGMEVFVDDILMHTTTPPENLQLLDEIFCCLHQANMTVKPSK